MSVNHGANLFDLSSELCVNQNQLMDFSSNINPFGSCPNAKKAIINNIDMVSIYPDPNYKVLKDSIAEYCGCNRENILLGAGATELISSFISIINPKKALLLSPAYSEYENELNKVNCNITKYFSNKTLDFKINLDDFISTLNSDNYDLVIICNPNNPTGFAFTKNEIKIILQNCNTYIMVDETYVEFTDTNIFSSTPLVKDYSKLFVIRGTSKFFSTPGIRLGYGLISDTIIYDKMMTFLDLWNINIFATIMGEVMFKDKIYINSTLNKIKQERDFLLHELSNIMDLKVYESYGNFILCEIKSQKFTAKNLYEKLMLKGIIIRNCTSFEGLDEYFFRVCILTHEENKILIDNLTEIFNN